MNMILELGIFKDHFDHLFITQLAVLNRCTFKKKFPVRSVKGDGISIELSFPFLTLKGKRLFLSL